MGAPDQPILAPEGADDLRTTGDEGRDALHEPDNLLYRAALPLPTVCRSRLPHRPLDAIAVPSQTDIIMGENPLLLPVPDC